MTDLQCELLFVSSLMGLSDDEYRNAYREQRAKEAIAETVPQEELFKMGYTKEMIEKVREELKNA